MKETTPAGEFAIRRHSFFRFVSAAAWICAIPAATGYAGPISVEDPASPSGRQISAVAQAWVRALLKKDFDTLASVAVSEYQEGTRVGLSDKTSHLYQALYLRRASPYRELVRIPEVEIALLRHKDLEYLGQGTTACFFDRANPPRWPADSSLLPPIERREDVYCIFLSRDNGRWAVSTDFAEQ